MSDSEMTWDVDMAVADVWLAVHHAVFNAVDDAMCWAVWRAVASPVDDAMCWAVDRDVSNAVYWNVNNAVDRAVNNVMPRADAVVDAVNRAVSADPTHPAFQDFL